MTEDNTTTGIEAIARTDDRIAPSKQPQEEKVLPEVTPSTEKKEYDKVAPDFVTGNQRVQNVIYYGVGGKEVKESDPHFAKKVTNTQGEKVVVNYYLAIYNGSLYNPAGPFSNRNKTLQPLLTFKASNKATFDDYVKYLDNKIESYYWRANRGVLNG